MDAIEVLTQRRSVRKYTDKQVDREALEKILSAATYAPTGMGAQSPVMVVVQDAETIGKLSKINAQIMGVDTDPFYGAPTLVIVFADKNRMTYVEDGSLVLGNLMNAAYALGVDSCWIHRAKQTFETQEGKELMKKWGLSEDYIGIGNCILGYADGPLPQAKPRKENYIIWA